MSSTTNHNEVAWFQSVGFLWLVVLVGATLRFATLGLWPLWIDEAYTLHDAHDVVPGYPLGYLMTRWIVAVLGDDEFVLRLLPCLFGIATLVILGLRGADRHETARFRLAAVLLALSSWHLFWSQSARYYAPLIFFVTVAARAIPTSSSGPDRQWQRWILAALAVGLAVLCHPSAAFFVPGAIVFAYPALAHRTRIALLVAMLVGLCLAVWRYSYLVPIHLRYKGDGSPIQFLTSYGFQAGPWMLAVALYGLMHVIHGRDHTHGSRLPRREICFGVLPGLIFFAISFVLFTTGYHAIATLPFAFLLAARGALSITGWRRPLVIAVLLVEQILGLVLYHGSHGMRPRYEEAAELIRQEPGALTYATEEAPMAYYLGQGRRILRDSPDARPLTSYLLDELADVLDGPHTVWIVLHDDAMHHWSEADRTRFEAMVKESEERNLPGSFGPKKLSLRVIRLP